jgi:hypothetical protein
MLRPHLWQMSIYSFVVPSTLLPRAETFAALSGQYRHGLDKLNDAVRAVNCST